MIRPLLFFLTLGCLASSVAKAQAAHPPQPFEPHEPGDYFKAARDAYNFDDLSQKPWRFKATYQVYDENSQPISKGVFEHWWASPSVYRDSWVRGGSMHIDWHAADGKHAHRREGVLDYAEYTLKSAFLSPLPEEEDLDPARYRLEKESLSLGGVKLECVKVILHMPQHGRVQQVPLGLFPTYCFSEKQPLLRVEYSWGAASIAYDQIVKVQGRYLPRKISIFEGKRKLLTAEVDTIETVSPSDPGFLPPTDLISSVPERVNVSPGLANGMLLKKVTPVYPEDAKSAHVSGTVILKAIIGRDGEIHDLRVVEAPWPSLAASAIQSVSQWRYKPYALNGEPVELRTTINVIFRID